MNPESLAAKASGEYQHRGIGNQGTLKNFFFDIDTAILPPTQRDPFRGELPLVTNDATRAEERRFPTARRRRAGNFHRAASTHFTKPQGRPSTASTTTRPHFA